MLEKTNTRSAIALRERSNVVDPRQSSMMWVCWTFHFTYGRAGALFSRSRASPTYFFLYQIGSVVKLPVPTGTVLAKPRRLGCATPRLSQLEYYENN